MELWHHISKITLSKKGTALSMQEVSHCILDCCQSANGFCFTYEADALSSCLPFYTREEMNNVICPPLSNTDYSWKPPRGNYKIRKNTRLPSI